MNVLVTGGAGYIGRHLVYALIEAGHEVRVIDDLSTGKLKELHVDCEFIKSSINEIDLINAALGGIDVVFHLAALTGEQRALDEPQLTHSVNVTGTVNILEAARRNQVKKVIYPSCDHYLDSLFTTQKIAAENYCRAYDKLFNLKTIVIQLNLKYGDIRENTQALMAAL